MHGFQGISLLYSLIHYSTRLLTNLQPKTAPSSSAASSQAPSTPTRAPASTPAAPPAPAPLANPAPAAPTTPSPAAPQASADTPALNDPSALLSGSQSEPVIAQMESMGFARDDITRAMRAAFFNPDRAIEYLLSVGLPHCFSFPRLRLIIDKGYPRRHPTRAAASHRRRPGRPSTRR